MFGKTVMTVDAELVARGEGHVIAFVDTVTLLGIEVGITGVQVKGGQGLRGPEDFTFDALVAGAAQVDEAVGGAVIDDLILKIDAVQAHIDAQAVPGCIAHARFVVPRQFSADLAFLDDLRDLRRPQGFLRVGVHVPVVTGLEADCQTRQPLP